MSRLSAAVPESGCTRYPSARVSAAGAIIDALRVRLPDCALVVSCTTPHGYRTAVARLGEKATCIYAPLDFVGAVGRAVATLRPDVLVCLETEIWPNWLYAAYRSGVRTALVNGRISVRTIRRYLKIRPLMRHTLGRMDAFSMISRPDAVRIRQIGAHRCTGSR